MCISAYFSKHGGARGGVDSCSESRGFRAGKQLNSDGKDGIRYVSRQFSLFREYVFDKNPFDVISGTDKIRKAFEKELICLQSLRMATAT